MITGNVIVDEVAKIKISGNITPQSWYKTIVDVKGHADNRAIDFLSDFVYWYKPKEVRDEETGEIIGYKKKFKADLLQRSYDALAEQFNCSKRQATDTVVMLEKLGVIKRVFRTLKTGQYNEIVLNNVLFIELIPQRLYELTYPEEFINKISNYSEGGLPKFSDRCHEISGEGLYKFVDRCHEICSTPPNKFGETTTEITTEITTDNIYCSERSDEPSKQQEEAEPLADVEAIILNTGQEWKPTQKQFDKWCRLYPNVDVRAEIGRISGWNDSHKTKRKTLKGIERHVNSWLDNAQNDYKNHVISKSEARASKTEQTISDMDRVFKEMAN